MEQIEAAPCTVLHAMAHKTKGETHIPRSNIIAEDKNNAEGTTEEINITLGWILNTRLLLVQLPNHKYVAWSGEINMILKINTVSGKTLEIILGKFENVASLMKMFGHFLDNIRNQKNQISQNIRKVISKKKTSKILTKTFNFL